jgi:hypothetical protein
VPNAVMPNDKMFKCHTNYICTKCRTKKYWHTKISR